jgi:uncharacterized membrane protein
VPPGTNGGVTLTGILSGFLGAFTIALTTALLLPFCPGSVGDDGWTMERRIRWVEAVTIWGGLGSLLDSLLGGWLQASVVDRRTGKVVEGSGGRKVRITLLYQPSLSSSQVGGCGLTWWRFVGLDHEPQGKLLVFFGSWGGAE